MFLKALILISGLWLASGRAFAEFSEVAEKASEVVIDALQLIGVRYRWGGDTPSSGVDCSGFVRYVFARTLGTPLPRRAEEMSRLGQGVRRSELQPGDLVFFNTRRLAFSFSHVGIYIGGDRFVHAPSSGHAVRIDKLTNRYWRSHYMGARRVRALQVLRTRQVTR